MRAFTRYRDGAVCGVRISRGWLGIPVVKVQRETLRSEFTPETGWSIGVRVGITAYRLLRGRDWCECRRVNKALERALELTMPSSEESALCYGLIENMLSLEVGRTWYGFPTLRYRRWEVGEDGHFVIGPPRCVNVRDEEELAAINLVLAHVKLW